MGSKCSSGSFRIAKGIANCQNTPHFLHQQRHLPKMRIETICNYYTGKLSYGDFTPWAVTSGAKKTCRPPPSAQSSMTTDRTRSTNGLISTRLSTRIRQSTQRQGTGLLRPLLLSCAPTVRLRRDRHTTVYHQQRFDGGRLVGRRTDGHQTAIQQPQSHDRLGVSRPISSRAKQCGYCPPTTYLDDKRRSNFYRSLSVGMNGPLRTISS